MKNDLHHDYAALCTSTTIPPTSEYLFGDLSKLTKDISDANKLAKKVRPEQARAHNRKYVQHELPAQSRQSAIPAIPTATE